MATHPHRTRWHATRAALALLALAWGMPALAAIALVPEWTGPATYTPGTSAAYTLTVTNNGPSTAVAPMVSDTLPVGLGSRGPSTGGCAFTLGGL